MIIVLKGGGSIRNVHTISQFTRNSFKVYTMGNDDYEVIPAERIFSIL